ncbi:MAG: type III-A CRISPR-associated protein Cas10/Csm1, partial [Chloroflexi bacterium]|nr:type III-A CRISPR-associated protein Cas10/Csm1 [Chloroflexota bacterium]
MLALTLDLLHRYTWCIAADTQEELPDVSLYDHLKTTAAIAACLYRYAESKGELNEYGVRESQDKQRFSLVVGDLSGIQDYIFHITSGGDREGKGAARRLRSRSLFIQLLTEVLAHRILHRFDLPITNVLMSSGGRFYLLVPNLPDTEDWLRDEVSFAERWLFEQLNAEVSVSISWESFGDAGFSSDLNSGWSALLRRLNEELLSAKSRRMSAVLARRDGWSEGAMLIGKDFQGARVCTSCNHRPQASGGDDEFCQWCRDDLRWGRRLPDTRWIAFYRRQSVRDSRDILGYSVASYSDLRHSEPDPYLVLDINHVNDAGAAGPSLLKLVANHVPSGEDREVLTFEQLAARSRGRKLLAFVKADVDMLGQAFAFGLEGWATPSRVATMSRQLEMFFTGWVEHRLRSDEFSDCYTVFSGGDDLFLVGPWNVVLDLVTALRGDFARWTAGNPNLTFSAGVLVADDHHPIPRAAHDVEERLEQAK